MTSDFKWKEVGLRIRHLRLAHRLSQQDIAVKAGITQNAVFRIEAGETNPQISTLSGIATALGTSVRELMGLPEASDSVLSPWIGRVKKIIGAGDEAAIQALQNGLENAELLLARSMRGSLPPIVVKGEDSIPTMSFWSRLPIRRRSEVAPQSGEARTRASSPARKVR